MNRAQVYSAARRHIRLPWPVRFALRIIPICFLLYQTLSLLQAMRCQSSPNFSFLRYGKADKHIDLDFSEDGGLIYWLSSTLLFWENVEDSCLAVDLIPSRSEPWDRKGSLSLLWPLFRSLCLGQFVETISCALQGRPLMTETGMSIFEHSLAFAEAEAMISSRIGLPWLWSAKSDEAKESKPIAPLLTRGEILDKMNVPPEVLLMCSISSLNSFSSQILGVLGMQSRFRLLNTAVWGLCYMSAFIWGFFSLGSESGPYNMILRFPTVCIVGFIPHLLILIGIILCGSIYALALLLCFLSPVGEDQAPSSLSDRFRLARENLQANAQFSSIRFDMHEDFYTALLKIGFSALTVASEAVYLNEGQRVNVAARTWLEEERLKELESFSGSGDPFRRIGLQLGDTADSNGSLNAHRREFEKSGYSRQYNVKAMKGFRAANRGSRADGIGHMQRGGRYLMVAQYFRQIFWLWVTYMIVISNKSLEVAGIRWRPQWLKVPKQETISSEAVAGRGSDVPDTLNFWMLSEDGRLESPKHNDVDVVSEMRKREQSQNQVWSKKQEQKLDADIYEWWKAGGWFGERDDSGSYAASQIDDDTTSMISFSTAASNTDDDASNSGASTPTQRRPYLYNRSISPTPSTDTPDNAFDPEYLAHLLDPQDKETRTQAAMLAHHLRAPSTTTRSQYRRAQTSATTKLLTSTHYRPPNSRIPTNKATLSPDEEAQLLEDILIQRRAQNRPSAYDHEAQGGPQCVVCQSAARTILAWPCRCLSLCEECRIQLAMNNFGTCVCCRQDVVGFSRLFVP